MKFVRGILLIINVVLAAGLLVSTLAGAVSPSVNIWPSLVAFGFLPLWLANVAMVVVWGLMRRWEALISVAVLAARWGMVGLFVQVPGLGGRPKAEEGATEVKVMAYNVHQFRGRGAVDRALDSITCGFIDLVDEQQPDVMCLQEFALARGVSVVDSLIVRGYNHYYGTYHTAKGAPYGTVVFSKLPITYVRRLDREKVLVELMHEAGSFRVCAVHVGSYHFEEADYKEIDQAMHGAATSSIRRTLGKVKRTVLVHERTWTQQLRAVVEECSVPLVVAGDMNDVASSWFYHQLSRHLTDTYCERGQGMGITYNGGFPQYRIDMIFHSQQMRALEHRRLKSDLSDHYPVVATLEFLP
ncbi:MAG: endonuclease/exonuclease/phosphatase family protein [Bacteroidales bacterium]|nr:endonuclease/exonuclease/phosphatase family protein [Bacteroidales bacterium]